MSKKKYLVCRNNAISNRRMKLIKRNIQMFICMTRYLFFRNINPCTEQTHVQTIFTSHTVQHVVPKTKRQCTIKTSVHDNLFGIKKTIFLSNILNQGMKKLTRKWQTDVLIIFQRSQNLFSAAHRITCKQLMPRWGHCWAKKKKTISLTSGGKRIIFLTN